MPPTRATWKFADPVPDKEYVPVKDEPKADIVVEIVPTGVPVGEPPGKLVLVSAMAVTEVDGFPAPPPCRPQQ